MNKEELSKKSSVELSDFLRSKDFDGSGVMDFLDRIGFNPVFTDFDIIGDQFQEKEFIYCVSPKGVYIQICQSFELHSGEFVCVHSSYDVTDEVELEVTLYVFGQPVSHIRD